MDPRFVGTWHISEEGAIWVKLNDSGISKYKTTTQVGAESTWWVDDGSLCVEYNAHAPLWLKVQRLVKRLIGDDSSGIQYKIVNVQPDRIRLQFSIGKPLTLIREDVPSH